MDLVFVIDDPWIIDSSEELLDEWMDEHTGDEVLDYLWGDKNRCINLVVSESK